jgi:hypothetical protein
VRVDALHASAGRGLRADAARTHPPPPLTCCSCGCWRWWRRRSASRGRTASTRVGWGRRGAASLGVAGRPALADGARRSRPPACTPPPPAAYLPIRARPLPYVPRAAVELLKAASSTLGMGPAHAMQVAERLYTQVGQAVGGGPKRCVLAADAARRWHAQPEHVAACAGPPPRCTHTRPP